MDDERLGIALVDEADLELAVEQVRVHLRAPAAGHFDGPVVVVNFGAASEEYLELDSLLELPWIVLDEGGALVLAAEDVPHARRAVSQLRRDQDAFAERLMDITGEQVDVDDLVAAAQAEPDELRSSWERLAHLVPKLGAMLRTAEEAGSAVAVVFG